MVTQARTIGPGKLLAIAGATLCLLVIVTLALPQDRYVRFNRITDASIVKLSWVYERTTFDKTPVDVVFVGSSHTDLGVDSARVEKVAATANAPMHVVNFAVQHLGRNMQWFLAREAFARRTPRLLVVELQASESRSLHPAFYEIAETQDLLDAPLVINPTYFSDLGRLPARQVGLFAQSLLPRFFGIQRAFDPATYRGVHWDDTYAEFGRRRAPPADAVLRVTSPDAAEMKRQRDAWQRKEEKIHLPLSLQKYETRANQWYVEEMIALARSAGAEVRFLYLPSYGDPDEPPEAATYARLAQIWVPPQTVLAPREYWFDVNHLNNRGAQVLAQWLGAKIAETSPGKTLLPANLPVLQ